MSLYCNPRPRPRCGILFRHMWSRLWSWGHCTHWANSKARKKHSRVQGWIFWNMIGPDRRRFKVSMDILLMMVEFSWVQFVWSPCLITIITLIVSGIHYLQLTSATVEQHENMRQTNCCSLSRQARWRQWLFPMATKAGRSVNKLEELDIIL